LTKQYQDGQLQLAEGRTRIKSLEDQLASERQNNADLRSAYAALQKSLDNSINQIHREISIFPSWLMKLTLQINILSISLRRKTNPIP
jgi:predicted  nucleic acid-binding Zn-ribbon protein